MGYLEVFLPQYQRWMRNNMKSFSKKVFPEMHKTWDPFIDMSLEMLCQIDFDRIFKLYKDEQFEELKNMVLSQMYSCAMKKRLVPARSQELYHEMLALIEKYYPKIMDMPVEALFKTWKELFLAKTKKMVKPIT